jgi:threonine dehydratase
VSVAWSDIAAAHERIRPLVHRTPVLTSRTFDERFGCRAFFKAECFQRAGSFKIRGATNAVLQLTESQRASGVLTFSSGNHAQALALAGREAGVAVTVVMPHDAPPMKKAATEGYGAELILYNRDEQTREALGARLCVERGLHLIPPYDDPRIIAGAGTAVKELLEDVPDLDLVLVCTGGGGLLAGSALAAAALKPSLRVIGVEPEAGDDICRSVAAGSIQTVHNPVTIADGARTPSTGRLNFPIIQQHVSQMTSVSDRALWETMYFVWTRMKIMIEPTGALAAAALWEGKVDASGLRVGIVISGGNVNPEEMVAWGLAQGLIPGG